MDNRSNDQSASFAVMKIANLRRSLEDEVVGLFFLDGESPVAGVAEELSFSQSDLRYDPEIRETERFSLNVYFSSVPSEEDRLRWIQRIQGLALDTQVTFRIEADRDWLAEWKKGFKPFAFAEPFWIVPRWLGVPDPLRERPEHVLLMEPGMAFGTGTHETTKLAAGLIVKVMRPGWQVFDVGTGTGILGLLTERMGAASVTGIDIDPEARRTARENLELNRALKTVIDDRDLQEIVSSTVQFDLVIANIIDGVLLGLAEDLGSAVKPGGRMIVSGILRDREDEFHREFADRSGCRELVRVHDGEWCASLWCRTDERV